MSNSLFINFTLTVSCAIFYILLFIVYFSRKNMPNIENKIYRVMLIFNGLSVFCILIYWSLCTFNIYDISSIGILNNIYILFIIGWGSALSFYIFIISIEKNNYLLNILQQNRKIFVTGLIIYSVLISAFLLFSPNSKVLENGRIVIVDNTLTIKFNMCIIFLSTLSSLFIILNRKSINFKKILPIFITVCLWVLGILFVFIDSTILVGHFVITISSFIMYFTIENPDLKLINQLILAKNEAEKASNAKSEFLSSMSHELRTPLNAIVGLSTMIKEEESREEINKDADDILKASNNLLELVDGILDINKLESNNMEIVNSSYNPRDLFDSIEKTTNIRIGDKPIEFRTRISEDLPIYLMGDKNKIKTIINNLISNAVKYTEKGHVDFNVDCVNNNGKCNLRFTISDTGRGIRDDQKQYLFQKFYRLEEDKDSDIEGTGLGLSITKSLVELIGGEINVNSTEGMGTTFMVTINQDIVDNNQSIEETELL